MTFFCLFPFILLFGLHNLLGLANAMMNSIDDLPGRAKVLGHDVQTYNMLMVLTWFLGAAAFIAHTTYMACQYKEKNRVFIIIAKVLFLGLFWAGIILFWQYIDSQYIDSE